MKFKLVLAMVLFFIFVFFLKNEDNSIIVEKNRDVIDANASSAIIQNTENLLTKNNICTNEPTATLLKAREIILLGEYTQQIQQIKESFKSQPLELQKKIPLLTDFKNRELHSIAFFYLAKDCFQMSIPSLPNSKEALQQFKLNQCNSFSEHILQKPLLVLEDLISENSLLGKTHYLTNAIKLSEFYKFPGNPEQDSYSREILARAEKLGLEAVGAGVREAIYAMSFAYREGIFGTIDPAKAYEYLLPLRNHEKGDDYLRVLSETKKQVKHDEINKIERLEADCFVTNNAIANPFK
ncbi:MAG: hypothetical protein HY253_00960 [Burkholderiales bacterium]|nr:hypothetical protein [Burkholderiales bacterium]